MAFLNTDKLWYIATYTDKGDFSSLSEKGYETLALANAGAGFPEGTPAGELVQDGEVVEKAPAQVAETPAEPTTEAPVETPVAPTEETPVVAPETAPTTEPTAPVEETAPVAPEAPVTGLESVPQGTENAPVTPEQVQGENVAPATESLPTEPVAPEVPAEPTAPATEETAPVTA